MQIPVTKLYLTLGTPEYSISSNKNIGLVTAKCAKINSSRNLVEILAKLT